MAHSTFNLIITLVWINLAHVSVNFLHPYHSIFITSLYVLDAACSYLNLEFAPGLWDVLTSRTPPGLEWLKNLPSPRSEKDKYGVYLIVLEKKGWRPRVYIGSSVSAGGYYLRTSQYHQKLNNMSIPRSIMRSINLGFEITHIGILARCSNATIPAVFNEMARLIILNLECTLTRIFFTRTIIKDWFRHNVEMDAHLFADCFLPGLVYWTSDSVEWDGLNTHSPISIYETPTRSFGLDDETVKDAEAKRRERRRIVDTNTLRKWRKRNLETGRYRCCGKNFTVAAVLKRHRTTDEHKRALGLLPPLKFKHPASLRATRSGYHNRATAKALRLRKHVCMACRPDEPFKTGQVLKQHINGPRHKKKMIALKKSLNLETDEDVIADITRRYKQTMSTTVSATIAEVETDKVAYYADLDDEIEGLQEPEELGDFDPGYASLSDDELTEDDEMDE